MTANNNAVAVNVNQKLTVAVDVSTSGVPSSLVILPSQLGRQVARISFGGFTQPSVKSKGLTFYLKPLIVLPLLRSPPTWRRLWCSPGVTWFTETAKPATATLPFPLVRFRILTAFLHGHGGERLESRERFRRARRASVILCSVKNRFIGGRHDSGRILEDTG